MMKLPSINLPEYPIKVRSNGEGKLEVWDSLRGKFVALTPEEYVRQRFTLWLIGDLHYPPSLMANEMSLTVNGLARRVDTMVADRRGAPFMVVEYKAPHVAISQAVFDQAAKYNMVLGAPYLVVTNGLKHYCCRMEAGAGTYHFIPQIPDYTEAMPGPIEN